MSLTTRAVIFELNISQFVGKKQDKKSAEEITQAKAAAHNAASVSKHLFADVKELEDISKFVALVRREFYEKTLPWSDSGQRLVPMEIFMILNDWLSTKKVEFEQKVDNFVSKYNDLVNMQSLKLGQLFNHDEYPKADQIKHKFKFNVVCLPVPNADDFRLEVEKSVKDELKEQYNKIYDERSKQLMDDLWKRLHSQLTIISDRLTDDKQGKSKIFRDSLVNNAIELCTLLKDLNVTKNKDLEDARQQLEAAITGITPSELRSNPNIKKDVKTKVDSVLSSYAW